MRIKVHNMCDRETVNYPLPLLTGDVEGLGQDGRLLVSASGDPDGVIDWPIVDGRFKVLVRLQPGENVINLRWEQESMTLRLTYDLSGFTHLVKPVYIVCADDDGFFQGPPGADCSPESAVNRIGLGSQLIQTLTAEKMREQGFGRVTFQLEMRDDHRPVCHVFQSRLRLEEAYAMNGYELWNYFGKELMTSPLFSQKSRTKFYCFMSFTRYHLPDDAPVPKTHSEILKYTQGHTALGGGALALFGTGNLHTWADSLANFNGCLTNRTRMDRRKLMDDSAYREYYWANYATGLGASLHELGHTFDLAHTPTGIMARGFDDLHKVFTVQRRRKSRHRQHHKRQHHPPRQRYSSTGSSASDRSRSTSSSSSIDDHTLSSSSMGSSTNSSDNHSSYGGSNNSHHFNTNVKKTMSSSLHSSSSSSSSNNKVSGGGGGGGRDVRNSSSVGSSSLNSPALKRKTDVCYGSPYKHSSLTAAKPLDIKPASSCSPDKVSSSTGGHSSSPSQGQRSNPNPVHTSSSVQGQPPPRQSTTPLVVSVEPGFKTSSAGSGALTFSVKNYDGSETRQTILEGQTVSELTLNPDGRVVNKNAKATERRPSAISISSVASSTTSLSSTSTPSTLPNSPDEPPPNVTLSIVNERPEVKYADSSHWFRSSAVVLRYHKWFNKPECAENGKNPTLQGPCIKSPVGLRLVELRTDPEGTVFHFWEFIGHTAPTEFTLRRSEVNNMPPEESIITIMAEDSQGFIMKKKFKIESFV